MEKKNKVKSTKENFEEMAKELVETEGSALGAVKTLCATVKELASANELTLNKAMRAEIIFSELSTMCEAEGTVDEGREEYNELTKINTYVAVITLREICKLLHKKRTDEEDNLLGRMLLFVKMNFNTLTWKELKRKLFFALNVEERKDLSTFINEHKDQIDYFIATKKKMDELGELFSTIESKSWDEDRIKREVVNHMAFISEKLITDGEVVNNLYAIKGDKAILMPMLYDNDDLRDKMVIAAKLMVKAVKPDAIVHGAEVWYVEEENSSEEMKHVRASQHPNRKEMLISSVQTAIGTWQMTQKFSRDSNGKPVFEVEEGPEKLERHENMKTARYDFELDKVATADMQ